MNQGYIKHLVECQCSLSIFKNKSKPVFHKIPVFSVHDKDTDNIEEKYIICENCDIVHRVHEVFTSEIKWGVEGLKSLVTTKEDVKFNLISLGHERLVNLLEEKDLHVSDWEMAEYFLSENIEGHILLEKNESGENIIATLIMFKNNNYKIKKEIIQRYI